MQAKFKYKSQDAQEFVKQFSITQIKQSQNEILSCRLFLTRRRCGY